MGQNDWYQNTSWDEEIEASFRGKLARSRSSRAQYLRIQASCLARTHPNDALRLIEEYLETGDTFDISSALCTRAVAKIALGEVADAVDAYKEALSWEANQRGVISRARLDFPMLVAERRLATEYDYAVEILNSRFKPSDHQFAATRYGWNGSHALIASDRGEIADAREFAERALRAAAETESPFQYHRSVGLVSDASDEFGTRLKRLIRPSALRSLLRLISPA